MKRFLRRVIIGLQTEVFVPESWDRFQFRGFLYVREYGRFVSRGKVNS